MSARRPRVSPVDCFGALLGVGALLGLVADVLRGGPRALFSAAALVLVVGFWLAVREDSRTDEAREECERIKREQTVRRHPSGVVLEEYLSGVLREPAPPRPPTSRKEKR